MTKEINKTILIAEDNFANYFLLKELLKPRNYNILRAKNGKEAVDIVQDNVNIDIVLMDINMPIMDGLEASSQIKTIKPDMPIVAQTAFYVDAREEEFKKAGIDACISKPIDIKALLFEIDSLMN